MFPYYGDPSTALNFLTKRKTNLERSKYVPWIRLTSKVGDGLVVESIPSATGFNVRYGDTSKSGMVGVKADGSNTPIYATETGDSGKVLHPSPTIETVNVSQGGNALSNRFEFTIKCSSVAQLQLLQRHFMEPGFAVLIEFGWNTSKSYGERADVSNVCDILKRYSSDTILSAMKNSDCEYFGVLGFIVGGDCTNDGTGWLLNAKIASMGLLPTYMQNHKGVVSDTTNKVDSLIFTETEIRNEKDFGKKSFMYMFNDLSKNIQTQVIKNLINQKSLSSNIPYPSEQNFINMIPDIIDEINSHFEKTTVYTTKQALPQNPQFPTPAGDGNVVNSITRTVELPDEIIKKTDRFISMELALAIINSVNSDINFTNPCNGSTSTVTPAFTINGYNTICRAFDRIFSMDSSKLYIPNNKLPSFKIEEYMKELTNINSSYLGHVTGSVIDGSRVDTTGQTLPRVFPDSNTQLTNVISSNTVFDKQDATTYQIPDLTSQQLKPRQWGYLRNLYINLDFFNSIVSKPNLLSKDVIYEMLNGLSSAVGNYWQFELQDCGEGGIEIVDLSLNPSFGSTQPKLPTISLQGKDSVVIGFNYNLDIPGAMMNKVMAERISPPPPNTQNASNFLMETDGISFQNGLFSNEKDVILDQIQNAYTAKVDTNVTKPTNTTEEDMRRVLSDFLSKTSFISREAGTVQTNLPGWLKSLFTTQANISQYINTILYAGCYNDIRLFRIIEGFDLKQDIGNGMLLPIKIQIDVPGISGLRVGDLFKVTGGIPQYEEFPFQIVKVEHEVGQQWITKIEAQIRNIKV